MMKLTVITPVHRPGYLNTIAKSMRPNIRWICVFYDTISNNAPTKAECIVMPKVESNWGVAKVNHALNFISNGFVYILDDDTVLHNNFELLLTLNSEFDFIHFNQEYKNGVKRTGGLVKRGQIDIGNFVVSRELIGDTFLKENDSMPDGTWAEELYRKAKNPLYLNKCLSYYNYLR